MGNGGCATAELARTMALRTYATRFKPVESPEGQYIDFLTQAPCQKLFVLVVGSNGRPYRAYGPRYEQPQARRCDQRDDVDDEHDDCAWNRRVEHPERTEQDRQYERDAN